MERKNNYDWAYFDKDSARELWNFVNEELDEDMPIEALQRLMYDKCDDLGFEEPWYDFEIVKKYKNEVDKFYKLFCEFQEILRKELKNRKSN